MHVFTTLFDAHWHVLGADVTWREIVGNVLGLASAVLGMRRKVWAWPVGLIGNVLLFTVFLGVAFHTPQDKNLWGQAGRQVMFAVVSVYGWYRWRQNRRAGSGGSAAAVTPRWAGWSGWAQIVAIAVLGTIVFTWLFGLLSRYYPSYPAVADAWIFTGSFLATYGMARGWTEFWLVWIAVDVVGVPLLLSAHFYPSALMYVVYGVFCVVGFAQWLRLRPSRQPGVDDPQIEALA